MWSQRAPNADAERAPHLLRSRLAATPSDVREESVAIPECTLNVTSPPCGGDVDVEDAGGIGSARSNEPPSGPTPLVVPLSAAFEFSGELMAVAVFLVSSAPLCSRVC